MFSDREGFSPALKLYKKLPASAGGCEQTAGYKCMPRADLPLPIDQREQSFPLETEETQGAIQPFLPLLTLTCSFSATMVVDDRYGRRET